MEALQESDVGHANDSAEAEALEQQGAILLTHAAKKRSQVEKARGFK